MNAQDRRTQKYRSDSRREWTDTRASLTGAGQGGGEAGAGAVSAEEHHVLLRLVQRPEVTEYREGRIVLRQTEAVQPVLRVPRSDRTHPAPRTSVGADGRRTRGWDWGAVG